MRTLAIDIETYSSVSLQKCGVYAYAQSPDFEILLFGYAWDDGPVEVIDLARGESLPEELQNALYDPEILKTAFNASFERTCLSAFMGRVTPPEQWSCTAVMARELGLPGSLEAVGEVIGLPEDKQKSKTGRALIRYFSIPCKPTKTNGNRTRNLPEHDPDRWAIYVEYNRQDVVSERAIRQKLSRFPVYEKEQPLWIHDQHINDRGVGVDLNLAEHAVEIDAIIKARLLEQAKELTGLENPKSTAQLKSWIEDTAGIEVESLNKKSNKKIINKETNEVRLVVSIDEENRKIHSVPVDEPNAEPSIMAAASYDRRWKLYEEPETLVEVVNETAETEVKHDEPMKMSDVVTKLESLFDILNRVYFDNALPKPVITVQSTPKAYGHCSTKKIWKSENDGQYEINIGAEFLNRPSANTAATMCHEMVHLYCLVNEIQDTCQKGRYHNKTFKAEAEARDLEIGYDRTVGFSHTNPTEAFKKTLEDNGFVLEVPFARVMPEEKAKAEREKPHRYVCPVCGQEVKTTADLSLICGICEVAMERAD